MAYPGKVNRRRQRPLLNRYFTNIACGARADRPELTAAVAYLRPDDMLTVTRLDRVGRTTVDTLKTVRDLDARGIRVTARDLDLDTATPAGKLVASLLASLAEWERETLRERTRAGLEHARSQGRHGGRPPALSPEQADAALAALRGGMIVTGVARFHDVSHWAIARLRDANP
ncbi:recombinase family protein [Dermacoccus nishinomiyaensis]|uniref:recombinase family protein n=1 Tax=Dermacoccus nishinomiyaensis TaxID=1274 RepID=UPI001EF4B55C|nr:recombinase family protein [Dermacoccus nishinomiyaensis]MCG7430837.1 recombinase family protein [Dermacoccus nishinomiyaensis]